MPTCQDMAKTSFSCENIFSSAVTACQVPCHSLQVSQELQMLSSLNLYSIVNLSRIYGKPWNSFLGFAVCQYSWGRRLFIQEIESIGRTLWSLAVSQSVALPLFFFREKRIFNARDICKYLLSIQMISFY